ncbi:MAG: TRAP transporter substrate-binding protein DctP [Spirochaetota bacterium]|nr:TRAP transporter substrate-binding protein DctP [Spirochaetota bacterium]
MRRSNKFYVSICILLCLLCGMIGLSEAKKKKNAKYVWKMATVAPDAAYLSEFLRDSLVTKFEKVTNNEVTVDMYWGGIMGDEEDYITKMRIGQLHGCVLSVGGVLMACPEMGVLQLPFLFNNYAEIAYIRKKLGKRFNDIYRKNGYKLIGWGDQDFDQIYSTKYEMKTAEEFRKCRFLTHAGLLEQELIKALGGSPIPVGVPEVVPSVRAGVCDTAISPALWWLGSQLYTITKYVNAYPFRYSPATLVVAIKSWDALPKKHRNAINKELPQLEKNLNKKIHEINRKCLKAMIDYGVKEVKMNNEEIEYIKKKTKPMWDKLAGKLYPKKLLDEILYHLKIYRSKYAKKDKDQGLSYWEL